MKICINGTVPSSVEEPVAGQGLKNSAHGQVMMVMMFIMVMMLTMIMAINFNQNNALQIVVLGIPVPVPVPFCEVFSIFTDTHSI